MSHFTAVVVLTALAFCVVSGNAASEEQHLPGGLHTRRQIDAALAKLAAKEDPGLAAYHALIEQADQGLNKTSNAVADFNVPGFYQDPAGHRNTSRALAGDAWVAYSCAIAYQLTPGEARIPYARKAIDMLDAWATTNKQASGYDGSLVMAYAGVGLVFAAQLTADFDGWDNEQQARFDHWLEQVFLPTCEGIVDRSNNWGDWGVLGCIAASAFLGDSPSINANIERIRRKIGDAIHTDGSMPHETRRGERGIWYTYFALAPLTAACQVAANVRGVDLFRYKGANGASIEDALDYLFLYCENPTAWPHHTGEDLRHPQPTAWPGNLFEAMSGIFAAKRYDAWVQDARPTMMFGHHYAWAVPTLLSALPPDDPHE